MDKSITNLKYHQMFFLGIDLGSYSIKLSVFDPEKGVNIGAVSVPDFEMPIIAQQFV